MLTLTAWARKVGVSRTRANEWLREGRIKAFRPCAGVILIEDSQKRPEHKTPWQTKHDKESVYDK